MLAERGVFRHALAETGIAIELHTLREETITEFLALLREHAAREEKLRYPWSSASEAVKCEPVPATG